MLLEVWESKTSKKNLVNERQRLPWSIADKYWFSALHRAPIWEKTFFKKAQRQNDLEIKRPISLLIPFLSPISIV